MKYILALAVLACLLLPLRGGAEPAPVPLPHHKHVSRGTALSPAKLSPAQLAMREFVSSLFPDVPDMVPTVLCESKFRQFGPDGTPLISKTDDVGVAQINIPTWGKQAKELGLDIYNSAADNLTMARIVYEKQGITAWTCAPG